MKYTLSTLFVTVFLLASLNYAVAGTICTKGLKASVKTTEHASIDCAKTIITTDANFKNEDIISYVRRGLIASTGAVEPSLSACPDAHAKHVIIDAKK
ncbi:MAG: hypothetical protein HQK91_10540 [Nitrospirae bacterium]|nr:hypothetical protein [Nitrospirota bacterium]MBF0541871.1 hypothetical protein [Nitrospirota bacterium]